MMKTFVTLAAFAAGTNALVSRGDSCCFHLTASGGASGSIGQLSDGQNRIGDNTLTAADYCINSSGGITDSSGRGCILTPPTTQFQCDKGASPTTGFSVAANGELEYNGSPSFIACQTGQNGGLNIYTTNSTAVTMCKRVTLKADSCSGSGAGAGASGASSSAASSAMSSAVSSAPLAHSSPAGSAPVSASSAPASSAPGASAPGASAPGASAPAGSAPSVPGGPASSAQCLTGAPVTTTVTVTDCSCATGAPAPGSSAPAGAVGGGSAAPSSSAPAGAVGGGSAAPSSSVPAGATGHGSLPSGSAGGSPAPSSSAPAGAAGGSSRPAPSSSVAPSGPAGGAVSSGAVSSGAVSSGAAGSSKPSTMTSVPASSASGTPSPIVSSGNHCPTTLSNGKYQYPHLIVPIDSSSPNSAPGTSYNGTVTSTISTIFNFDIPQDYFDNTCSLVFLFPKKADLETSSYSFSGDGKIDISKLSAVATQSTDYSNAPSVAQDLGYITISPGNSYVVSTFACPAGQTVAYEMKNAGSTNLNFFEDWNPSPLGLFITTC